MKFTIRLSLWLTVAGLTAAAAAEEKQLPIAGLSFSSTAADGIIVSRVGDPDFVANVQRSGGTVSAGDEPVWEIAAGAPPGDGVLDFAIERQKLAGDVALVIKADWSSNPDLTIQLYDAHGRMVAPDLFGDLARNAKTVATDTFIVPLSRYPLAARISLQRLGGALRVYGIAIFPVLSELSLNADAEKELAKTFTQSIGSTAGLLRAAGEGQPAIDNITAGKVHAIPPLEKINEIGAAALTQAGYPPYRPITQGSLRQVELSVSCTTYDFMAAALRTLTAASGSALKIGACFSSDGVEEMLVRKGKPNGFLSVPLSSAEKEQFFAAHGYAIVEIPIARDALEVLVNAANPVRELSIPQLDAIFSTTRLAGAAEAITRWEQLGGSGVIKPFGGVLTWGTTRTFQQLVLKGGRFRSDMHKDDVVFRSGVEEQVAKDPQAIGFTAVRRREADVRPLAIRANSGEKAWPLNAESIYSSGYPLQRKFYCYLAARSLDQAAPLERELVNLLLSDAGQTLVARSGSLPLTANEVAAARAELGLPR